MKFTNTMKQYTNETSWKKNTENNVPKKAFAMTCFDLQQTILIKYIFNKSFMNSSRKHKEISGFEVFNSTFRWIFCSFSDSGQDLSLNSPTRFQLVLHSSQQKNSVFRSPKHTPHFNSELFKKPQYIFAGKITFFPLVIFRNFLVMFL